MAEKTFVKVGGTNNSELEFIRPGELAKSGKTGLVLEGVYIAALPSNLDPAKNDFKFQTENKTVIINGCGSLAYKMALVTPGTLVRVSYNGTSKIAKGKMAGREAHSFDVEVQAE